MMGPGMELRLLPLVIGPAILLPLASTPSGIATFAVRPGTASLLLAIALWSAAYAVGLMVGDFAQKLLALKISTSACCRAAGGVDRVHSRLRRARPGDCAAGGAQDGVVAAIVLLTAWTNEWHGLFWGQMTLQPSARCTRSPAAARDSG